MTRVHASYFTDPACPWSWALEPSMRRLAVEFGESVQITYVMGGLARDFAEVDNLVGLWLDAADRSGMPTDPRLWRDGGPASSYPACLAVKAAAEQGDPEPYLRRLREGLMCGRRKLDTTEALVEEARADGSIDIERFRIDLGSDAIVELFGGDLDRAAAASPSSPARVELPTLVFRGAGDEKRVLGFQSYAEVREAALEAGAQPSGATPPGVEEALARFGSLATPEVAAICDLPGPRAAAELWRLALEWRVRPQRRLTGELWMLAESR